MEVCRDGGGVCRGWWRCVGDDGGVCRDGKLCVKAFLH